MPAVHEPIRLQDRYIWSDEQIGSEVDGNVVLMNLAKGHYYGLDTIGSDIWRRLEHGPEVGAMVRELAEIYHHDAAEVERDVLALMEKMRAQNLIRRVS